MLYHKYEILKYLPKRTVIRSLPESHIAWSWGEPDSINIEEYNLKTSDVVSAFYHLQDIALKKVAEERNEEKRMRVTAKIKGMVYF